MIILLSLSNQPFFVEKLIIFFQQGVFNLLRKIVNTVHSTKDISSTTSENHISSFVTSRVYAEYSNSKSNNLDTTQAINIWVR